MFYRIIQVGCTLVGLVALALLITTGGILASIWNDYGFGNCLSGCEQTRASFFWMAGKSLLTFAIPLIACAVGFWVAGSARRKQLKQISP